MKEITIKIPDEKLSFFMKLVEELGLDISEKADIPEEHKKIVRERIKTEHSSEMKPWKSARKELVIKNKS